MKRHDAATLPQWMCPPDEPSVEPAGRCPPCPDSTDPVGRAVDRPPRTRAGGAGPGERRPRSRPLRAASSRRRSPRVAGRRFGVACSSGTAGLHMAVRALGIGDGDEVITTPFSFVASANCLLYERARPRFVDIEEDTLGLDPDLVGRRGRPTDRGHPAGPCVRAAMSHRRARRRSPTARGWTAHRGFLRGARLVGRRRGRWDRSGAPRSSRSTPTSRSRPARAAWSSPTTRDARATFRSLRNQGRDEDGTWLRHVRLGYNYRLDELSAAVGVAQLERLEELAAGRARVAAAYERALAGRDWLRLPAPAPDESVDWFVYVVRLDPSIDRDRGDGRTRGARASPSRPYFSPLHLQPFYRERSDTGRATSRSPNASRRPRSRSRSRPSCRTKMSATLRTP